MTISVVDLGYPCDRTAACQKAHSECDSYVCKCKMGYYDTNLDTSLGGDCNKSKSYCGANKLSLILNI